MIPAAETEERPWHVRILGAKNLVSRWDKRDADEVARRAIVTTSRVEVFECKGLGCECGSLG